MKTVRVRSGELEISCHQSEGRGPAVVLVHGNSSSSRCFERQLTGELGRRYAVTAIDLPGHGTSSRAMEAGKVYSVPGYATVLTDVAGALGLRDAVFAGWSLGGHVLLEAMDALPGAKGLMILAAPPIGGLETLARAFRPHPIMGSLYKAGLTDQEVAAWAAFCGAKPGDEGPWADDIRRSDPLTRACLGASIRPGGYRDEADVVGRLACPLAVVVGDSDPLINPDYLEGLAMPTLWRRRVQSVAGGHAVQWENTKDFDALMGSFVEECVNRR